MNVKPRPSCTLICRSLASRAEWQYYHARAVLKLPPVVEIDFY